MNKISDKDLKKSSDEELMIIFKGGDIKAFDELVNRYKDEIVNYLFRFTGDYAEADDIAQDSFIRLYKYKDKFDDKMKFNTWFYTIAINRARSHKSEMAKKEYVSLNDFTDDELNNIEHYSDPAEDEDRDEIEYYNGLKIEIIKKAFDLMDDVYREVILLRYVSEFEYEKISEILNIPAGTVKSRISRGKAQLKEIIKAEYNEG